MTHAPDTAMWIPLPERLQPWLVLIAGLLAVGAFAPFGYFPLAYISLAVLFNQWLSDTPRQALRHGGLFGLGFFAGGVSWVYVSVHVYGQLALPVSALIAVLFVLVLAVFPALAGYLLRRYLPVNGWAGALLVLPSGWVLAEWLRGRVFTGFPWLDTGASQIDGPLAAYLPIVGEYGVAWLLCVCAVLLAAIAGNRRRVTSLVLLAVVIAAGYLLENIEWTTARGEPIRVSLVQGNIAQADKWAPENLESTLRLYAELTAAQPDSELVVWPETAIPAFYHQVEDSYIPYLEEQLAESGTSLLTGIPVLDRETWTYYNSIIALNGSRGFYHKQHLVAFGEYLPLRWLIGDTLDALAVPNADFTPGKAGQALLQAAGYPVGSSICFEVAFARVINDSLPEAAFLVNVSNDGWFGRSLAPFQHLEIARVRAKETGRALLRATNTGISAIINHDGTIQSRSRQFEQAVVNGHVVPRQGATPYVRYGDWPVVLVTVFCLLLVRVRMN
ncbi:MAG: apolipoprotein N-acyltransferase [Gammaproteobacteria bacterium]|nr:apolipoprotein N-acyltransferase [Gammaproteobacteria bacterium]